jgi:hypothetical protein
MSRSSAGGRSLRRPTRDRSRSPSRPACSKRVRQRNRLARLHPVSAQIPAIGSPSAQRRSAARRRRTTAAAPGTRAGSGGRPPCVATNRKSGPSWSWFLRGRRRGFAYDRDWTSGIRALLEGHAPSLIFTADLQLGAVPCIKRSRRRGRCLLLRPVCGYLWHPRAQHLSGAPEHLFYCVVLAADPDRNDRCDDGPQPPRDRRRLIGAASVSWRRTAG